MSQLYIHETIYEQLRRQLQNFFADIDLSVIEGKIDEAYERCIAAISVTNNKYLNPDGIPRFMLEHSGCWSIFLYYLSNSLRNIPGGAETVYYLNKILHSVDWFYEIELPSHFMVEHPLGSVLGRADYGDFLFIYQGVTVGGNISSSNGVPVYPTLGNNIILFSDAKVLGDVHVGNNVIFGANSYVINEDIPDDSMVFGMSPNLVIKHEPEKNKGIYEKNMETKLSVLSDASLNIIVERASLKDALERLDKVSVKVLLVIDLEERLVAALTDGDVRRAILAGASLTTPVSEVANYSPQYLEYDDQDLAQMYLEKVTALPLVDLGKKIVKIYVKRTDKKENPEKTLNLPVVIMAGGLGTRLYPYTKIFPKPLIPILDTPISERIIQSFQKIGCDEFHMIVNYKRNMIKAYYNDMDNCYNVHFWDEEIPLGTGGGLYFLKDYIKNTFILTNCDVLILDDVRKMVEHHKKEKNKVTMVCSLKNFEIPYGIVNFAEGGEICSFEEKPQMSFFTNTGYYILEPDIFSFINQGEKIGMPDIIDHMRLKGEKVGIYPISENAWLDMGQFDTMESMERKNKRTQLGLTWGVEKRYMLRICFVGLGSIGKRHIKNVVHLLNQRNLDYEIDAVRSTDKPISPEINSLVDHLYYNVEELQGEYDIIFITNPTVCHYDTIKRFGRYTKHMFIEKPVFHKYVEDIDQLNLNSDGIYYVACPLRYSAVLQDLKGRLSDEKVYSVRAISSSYLPDWRTGVDYRHVYSAHKNMGGGVTLDLIHELDYVVWLFGIPDWSYHLCGKFSELEIDSDDLSVYLLKYPDKAVEIHTDYFGRESVRKIELYCRDYVMEADLIHNTLKYMYGKGNTESVNMTENDIYLQEMKAFFDMIEGQRNNDNDIIYANEILKIALAD